MCADLGSAFDEQPDCHDKESESTDQRTGHSQNPSLDLYHCSANFVNFAICFHVGSICCLYTILRVHFYTLSRRLRCALASARRRPRAAYTVIPQFLSQAPT